MKKAQPAHLGFDAKRLDRIVTWMESYVSAGKFPGSSLLICRDGHEVFHHATGLRSIETGKAFERDTVVRIYSMSKPVTSVAIMMLAERGLFHLDAPVSDFIPAFSDCRALIHGAVDISQTEPCATPTLHQLLTHTSGLSYPFNPGVLPEEMQKQEISFSNGVGPLEDMADRLAALPLAFHPGTRWEYSTGTDIMGRVVEVVSGKTLDAFFDAEILSPLGMKETSFKVRDDQVPRFAALYSPLDGDAMAINDRRKGPAKLYLHDSPETSPFRETTTFSGGGGLVGTIDDYMRFAEMIRRGGALDGVRLLSPRTVDFMTRNHLPGDIAAMGPSSFSEQPMTGMGFGLAGAVVLDPARARAPGSVGDFSWGGMASTFFWVDRKHDMSVVFFTQVAPSSSYPARPQLKALVHGAMTS